MLTDILDNTLGPRTAACNTLKTCPLPEKSDVTSLLKSSVIKVNQNDQKKPPNGTHFEQNLLDSWCTTNKDAVSQKKGHCLGQGGHFLQSADDNGW